MSGNNFKNHSKMGVCCVEWIARAQGHSQEKSIHSFSLCCLIRKVFSQHTAPSGLKRKRKRFQVAFENGSQTNINFSLRDNAKRHYDTFTVYGLIFKRKKNDTCRHDY